MDDEQKSAAFVRRSWTVQTGFGTTSRAFTDELAFLQYLAWLKKTHPEEFVYITEVKTWGLA